MTQHINNIIITTLKDFDPVKIGIFGSYARNEQTENSDIDILVKFIGAPTFASYLRLEENLRNRLGREVDLITEGGVNKFLRPYIERDLKLVYGQR